MLKSLFWKTFFSESDYFFFSKNEKVKMKQVSLLFQRWMFFFIQNRSFRSFFNFARKFFFSFSPQKSFFFGISSFLVGGGGSWSFLFNYLRLRRLSWCEFVALDLWKKSLRLQRGWIKWTSKPIRKIPLEAPLNEVLSASINSIKRLNKETS